MDDGIKGIYIDLDSIFDTRLGTIAEIDPALIEVVFDEKYLFRNTDDFKVIKKQTYRDLYALRDFTTLKLSPYTAIFEVVNNIIKKLLEMTLSSPEISGVKLYVNLYPFVLPDNFVGELLELIVTRTGKLAYVEIINVPPKELTFSYCGKLFDFLIMYDYNAFLETNILSEQHKKTNINDRTLIAPELYYRDFTKEEIDTHNRKHPSLKGKTPSEILRMVASPAVILELIEPMFFSTDIKLYSNSWYSPSPPNENEEVKEDKVKEEEKLHAEPNIVPPKVEPTEQNKNNADDFLT